jgi:hypothetical protein
MNKYLLTLFLLSLIITTNAESETGEIEKSDEKLNSEKADLQKEIEKTTEEKESLEKQREKIENEIKDQLEQTEKLKEQLNMDEQLKQMPELDKITKQLDMLKNLGCFMIIQKSLKEKEQVIYDIMKRNKNEKGIKKVIGQYFKVCQEKIPREDQMKLFGAEEVESFKSLESIPVVEILENSEIELDELDLKYFNEYDEMEKNLQKMKKDLDKEKKKENASTSKTNTNQKKTNNNNNTRKENINKKELPKKRSTGINIFGIYLNEVHPLIWISILGLFLAFPFYFLWKILFNENPKQLSKKELKKLKKQK